MPNAKIMTFNHVEFLRIFFKITWKSTSFSIFHYVSWCFCNPWHVRIYYCPTDSNFVKWNSKLCTYKHNYIICICSRSSSRLLLIMKGFWKDSFVACIYPNWCTFQNETFETKFEASNASEENLAASQMMKVECKKYLSPAFMAKIEVLKGRPTFRRYFFLKKKS